MAGREQRTGNRERGTVNRERGTGTATGWRWEWGPVLLAAVVVSGCGRSLTIEQDKYINTACHENRPPDRRTGEPLELNIVVVYASDWKKPGNELLRPDSKITAKDWYERRPLGTGEPAVGRFQLPHQQVYVLSNDDRAYGQRIGSALRGAALDGDKPIRKTGIAVKWDTVHSDDTVIYVFPKFCASDGGVLPVLPAKFHPPGAYSADLAVKVGVQADRRLPEAQYVQVLSPRKLHGRE